MSKEYLEWDEKGQGWWERAGLEDEMDNKERERDDGSKEGSDITV